MPTYLRRGSIPRKRHIAHPAAPGFLGEGLHYEEVVSTAGFSRAYSIAYHLRPPTRTVAVEALPALPAPVAADLPLRHVHLRTGAMPRAGDAVTGRVPLFFNADAAIARCRPLAQQQELYRNARCDELLFVHHGAGRLRSMFGTVAFGPMDYLVIPKCTTYLLEFDDHSAADLLVVEAAGSIRFPSRYLNPDGQFQLGAPLSERDLRGPTETPPIDREERVAVRVKDGERWTQYVMANHPFDVVGWDGMVYPFAFNADDFEPITGTIHQPPPIHQTFQGDGFVVCTFAPRLLDTHPEAIKVPYAHSNVESDELLYYVRGEFGSRKGVESGSLTLHPHGIPHGPHPGRIVASRGAVRTDELAVMVDTFRPLKTAVPALAFDDPGYPLSWM
jgi:homogentisate 1,2-dioxygenase